MNPERPASGEMASRVLHAVRHYGRRSETFIADIVEDLDKLGWQAWVASGSAPVNRDEFPFPPGERTIVPRRPPLARRLLFAAVGRSQRVRSNAWWRPTIEAVRPAIIHAHFGWTAADTAFEAFGVPLVVSFHGSDVRRWPHHSELHRQMYAELLENLRYAVASSNSIAAELRSLGYGGRLEVIPPGVRLDRYRFRLRDSAEFGRPRLLYVGRQVRVKGLDVLLRAMPQVIAASPRATLTVIGEGPERANNECLVRELGIGPNVEFLGAQPHGRVTTELKSATALIVPSRTTELREAEGHPVAPKEAFAAGVPVVATDSGGLREVVPPTQRDRLVRENDPDALAQMILNVLAAPGLSARLAVEARRWAESQHDSRGLARRLAELYGEILADASRRSSVAAKSGRRDPYASSLEARKTAATAADVASVRGIASRM